jgi:hypothetical protein
MFTMLFNCKQTEMYSPDVLDEDEESEFEHTFGGEACHDGTIPPECSKPVHLFYNLDLSDPQVGITLCGLKKLPLYYALGNLGGPFSYRVVSDSQIEILCQPYPKQYRAGIMREYPEPFELEKVEFYSAGYDANDPQAVWYAGGILGIAKLTAKQKTALRKKLEKWHLKTIGCPLIDEGDDPDQTIDEIAAQCNPFTQGMPGSTCPNPKCANHKSATPLPVLLFTQPDEEDDFYKLVAGGDSGQLIWQVCPKCASVVVDNPCT